VKDFLLGLLVIVAFVWYFLPSSAEAQRDQDLKDLHIEIDATIWVKKEKKIYKKDYPAVWAFDSGSVTIGCDRYPLIYVVDYDNNAIKYGLNGKSKRHYSPLDNNLLLEDKDIQVFLNEALALCDVEKTKKKLKELKEKEVKLEALQF